MKPSIWTSARQERVADLWKTHSSRQICEVLLRDEGIEVTRNQVIGIAHRMGLSADDKTEIHPHTSRKAERRALKPHLTKPKLKIISDLGSKPVCTEVASKGLTLADLPQRGCRYIAGDDNLYCGMVQRASSSYCPAHHVVVWKPPLKRWQGAAA